MVKFRVFNKATGIYHNNFVKEMLVHKDNENNCFVIKGYDDCQLIEMSTGLKDKNEKEIFVGDIVSLGSRKTVVNYDVLTTSFVLDSGDITYKLTSDKNARLEIVGNINLEEKAKGENK